jgi:hypothetical protein
MDGKERMDVVMTGVDLSQTRHPELVSGSYYCNDGQIKVLKQVQHDGATL